jgi:hypothetical protein
MEIVLDITKIFCRHRVSLLKKIYISCKHWLQVRGNYFQVQSIVGARLWYKYCNLLSAYFQLPVCSNLKMVGHSYGLKLLCNDVQSLRQTAAGL